MNSFARFYEDGDFTTHQGFRSLAMDGSVIELSNTKETQAVYGYASTHKKGFRVVRMLSSYLYDLENRLVISTCLGHYDDNERDFWCFLQVESVAFTMKSTTVQRAPGKAEYRKVIQL